MTTDINWSKSRFIVNALILFLCFVFVSMGLAVFMAFATILYELINIKQRKPKSRFIIYNLIVLICVLFIKFPQCTEYWCGWIDLLFFYYSWVNFLPLLFVLSFIGYEIFTVLDINPITLRKRK